jgi:hypothetical protein
VQFGDVVAYLFLLLSDTDAGQVWAAMAHEALLIWWRPLNTPTSDIIADSVGFDVSTGHVVITPK